MYTYIHIWAIVGTCVSKCVKQSIMIQRSHNKPNI